MPEKPSFIDRLERVTRFTIMLAIAVVLGLIITTPRNQYPLNMSRAEANILGAAPGYLMTSIIPTTSDKLYLVDTDHKIICVYNTAGNKLRLIAARKFDIDSQIPDAGMQGRIRIEGNANGINYDEAKQYLDEYKKSHPNP